MANPVEFVGKRKPTVESLDARVRGPRRGRAATPSLHPERHSPYRPLMAAAELVILLVLWLLPTALVGTLASHKGRSAVGYGLFALVFWPLALIVVLLAGDRSEPREPNFRSAGHVARTSPEEAVVQATFETNAAAGPEDTPVQMNPVGLGTIFLGALASIIGIFLPFYSSAGGFSSYQDNSIAEQSGWWLIAVAISVAGVSYGMYASSYRKPRSVFLALAGGAAIVGFAIHYAVAKSLHTLYPVVNGKATTSAFGQIFDGTHVGAGVGPYVFGAGGGIMILGVLLMAYGWLPLASAETAQSSLPPKKKCPDCAEFVMAGARVCRYCGFRFDGDPNVSP